MGYVLQSRLVNLCVHGIRVISSVEIRHLYPLPTVVYRVRQNFLHGEH